MKFSTFILLFLILKNTPATVYDTLPQGVNTLVFKNVQTSKINSKFNDSKSEEALELNETFSPSSLSDINDVIKSYFDELKKISPEAFNAFSLGEFEANGEAEVSAQGLGLGHGITNHLTIYASVPIYHLKSEVSFHQKGPSNLNQIKNTLLNSNPTSAIGTFVKQLTLQLPETNEELLQSVLVNYYNYKPLGTWEKTALGDAELGAIYRLTDFRDMGSAFTVGATLPTGTPDDSDSLQDISTGDGQFDAFVESSNGISFLNNSVQLGVVLRYTYQFESMKKVRLYEDPEIPLSKDSATVKTKLGNKFDSTIALSYLPTNYLNFGLSYLESKIQKTNYNLENQKVKNALEFGTESSAKWAKASVGFTTIELYKKKKMELPFEVILSTQKLLNAKNSASYERYDLDFKFYF